MSSASLYLLYAAYKSCMKPSWNAIGIENSVVRCRSPIFYCPCQSSRLGNHPRHALSETSQSLKSHATRLCPKAQALVTYKCPLGTLI
jgi:hypothetical protein